MDSNGSLNETPVLAQQWTSVGVLLLFLTSTVGLGLQVLIRDRSESPYLLPFLAILDALMIVHYFSRFLPTSRKLFATDREAAVSHARLFWMATIAPSIVALIASAVIGHLYHLAR